MDTGVKSKSPGASTERSRRGSEPAAHSIRNVAIIGAGQMGNGIAHVIALAGYDVAMSDLRPEAVEKARGTIERNIQKGLITEANYNKYLAALPDLASKATFVDYSVDEDAEVDDEDED